MEGNHDQDQAPEPGQVWEPPPTNLPATPYAGAGNVPHAPRAGGGCRAGLKILVIGFILVAIFSGLASVAGAWVFWAAYQYQPEWAMQQLSGRPLGMLEPFEVVSRFTEIAPNMSPDESYPDVDLNSQASTLWDRWMTEEYARQTGLPNPYSVHPGTSDSAELAERQAALNAYQEHQTANPRMSADMMFRVAVFDALIYFTGLVGMGTLLVGLIALVRSLQR